MSTTLWLVVLAFSNFGTGFTVRAFCRATAHPRTPSDAGKGVANV